MYERYFLVITGHRSLRSKFAAGVRKRRRSGKRGAAARGWGGRQSTQKVYCAYFGVLWRSPRALLCLASLPATGCVPWWSWRSLVVVSRQAQRGRIGRSSSSLEEPLGGGMAGLPWWDGWARTAETVFFAVFFAPLCLFFLPVSGRREKSGGGGGGWSYGRRSYLPCSSGSCSSECCSSSGS